MGDNVNHLNILDLDEVHHARKNVSQQTYLSLSLETDITGPSHEAGQVTAMVLRWEKGLVIRKRW